MLAPAAPSLTGNGLAMRLGLFLETLAQVGDVDLAVVPIFGPVGPAAIHWAESLAARVCILDPAGAVDTHFELISRVKDPQARAQAFALYGKPSLASRLPFSFFARAVELLKGQDYDLLHAGRSYCAPLALALAEAFARRPALTLDLDEDDSRVHDGLATLAGVRGRSAARQWELLEAEGYRRLIAASAPRFDRVFVSSPADAASLRGSANLRELGLVPNAVARAEFVRRRDDGRTLLFVGALGYEPNRDAVAWFLSNVWRRLPRRADLRLRVVGADAPPSLRRLAAQPGVEMLGWVSDLRACWETATLSIAPIRVGAGTRIKLLESALHGVPIISTTLGAEGLGLKSGRDCWLADSAQDFAAAVLDALARPRERERRAGAARALATREYTRDRVVMQQASTFCALL